MEAVLLGTASVLSQFAWRRSQASGQEKGVRENQKGEMEGCGKRKGLWVAGKKVQDGRGWVAECVHMHV